MVLYLVREETGEVGRVPLRLAVQDARQSEVGVQPAQEAVDRRARWGNGANINNRS